MYYTMEVNNLCQKILEEIGCIKQKLEEMEKKLDNQTNYFEKNFSFSEQQVMSTQTMKQTFSICTQTEQGETENAKRNWSQIERESNSEETAIAATTEDVSQDSKIIRSAVALSNFCVAMKNQKVYNDHKPDISVDSHKRAEYIARCVETKFKSMKIKIPDYSKYKVLASIVMTKTGDRSYTQIVSISTGTKCLSEIMSRRCFVSYLYDQLEFIANSKDRKSIFTPSTEDKSYKLKNGIEFHLYISTIPCGDAYSKNQFVGRLRVKKEASGGIPIVKNNVRLTQKWDEVTKGKLLTMSCSDKICQWNVVGLQGALLSHFIEPIYLKSVIIRGNHIDKTALQRAICGRIENYVTDLPTEFYLNHPSIYIVDLKNSQNVIESPNFSLNWCSGNPDPEIIDRRGRPECGAISRSTRIETSTTIRLYCDFKKSAGSYKIAKERLRQAFILAGLGAWVTKPAEQDRFEVAYN